MWNNELISKPLAAGDDSTLHHGVEGYLRPALDENEPRSDPGAGDVAGGAEYRPTPETEYGLVHDLERTWRRPKGIYKNLMTKEVPAFNHAPRGTEHDSDCGSSSEPAAKAEPKRVKRATMIVGELPPRHGIRQLDTLVSF